MNHSPETILKIRRTLTKTRKRHRGKDCKTYTVKVDKSHLSEKTLEDLSRLFLEAKWFYNNMIASGNVWNTSSQRKRVIVLNRDKKPEVRELKFFLGHYQQSFVKKAKSSIRGLSTLKKNGHKVGRLKFKSRIDSLPSCMSRGSFKMLAPKNYLRVMNIKQRLRVNGLDQIPKGAELGDVTFGRKNGDFYFRVIVYLVRPKLEAKKSTGLVGIDFGIKHQLTLSNGARIEEVVPITKKIRRLHRRLSRRSKLIEGGHSKNWFKVNQQLNREYEKIANQRKDIRHKVVHGIFKFYPRVVVQNDNIRSWQRMWGRRVTTSTIGGIMSDIKSRTSIAPVDRFFPSTKTCPRCHEVNKEVGGLGGLGVRVFECTNCGLVIDRDLAAALNIKNEGVPAERREFTPVDTRAATSFLVYLNKIPRVLASPVVETGSPRLLAER